MDFNFEYRGGVRLLRESLSDVEMVALNTDCPLHLVKEHQGGIQHVFSVDQVRNVDVAMDIAEIVAGAVAKMIGRPLTDSDFVVQEGDGPFLSLTEFAEKETAKATAASDPLLEQFFDRR